MMVFLIVMEWNPEIKVGIQVFRDIVSHANSSLFGNNILDMFEHVTNTMTNIKDLGETHANLIKGTFDDLLVAPNS